MKKNPWITCALLSAFAVTTISTNLNAMPTEKFKNTRELLANEKKNIRKNSWKAVMLPFFSTRLKQCKRLHRNFEAAYVHMDASKDAHAKKKADRTLKKYLERIQKESVRVDGLPRVNDKSAAQKSLDSRIRDMTIDDLAKLLIEADKTLPPAFGDPVRGIALYRDSNIIFKIISASGSGSDKSQLEEQIALETEKMSHT